MKKKETDDKGEPDGKNADVYFGPHDADYDGNNKGDQRKYGYSHNTSIIVYCRKIRNEQDVFFSLLIRAIFAMLKKDKFGTTEKI